MKGLLYFPRLLKQKSQNDRLIMTILCRNEVDIIEYNIRVHASLGVDAFVVMDNGSTDGTRELLDSLKQEFELHIIDQTGVYQQAKWMKQLMLVARDQFRASWVISNDADELWLPNNGQGLKTFLNHSDSVITVQRSNMLLTEEALQSNYHFSQAQYRVQFPICYDREAELTGKTTSMLFANISPKVIVNPYGFMKISGGNHRAKHLARAFTARKEKGIRVYHYPIRSYAQFEANIQNRVSLLKKNARMGDHYRRWVKLYQSGHLKQEFQSFIVDEKQRNVLKTMGIILQDRLPKTRLFEIHKEAFTCK